MKKNLSSLTGFNAISQYVGLLFWGTLNVRECYSVVERRQTTWSIIDDDVKWFGNLLRVTCYLFTLYVVQVRQTQLLSAVALKRGEQAPRGVKIATETVSSATQSTRHVNHRPLRPSIVTRKQDSPLSSASNATSSIMWPVNMHSSSCSSRGKQLSTSLPRSHHNVCRRLVCVLGRWSRIWFRRSTSTSQQPSMIACPGASTRRQPCKLSGQREALFHSLPLFFYTFSLPSISRLHPFSLHQNLAMAGSGAAWPSACQCFGYWTCCRVGEADILSTWFE